ncbi:hypothetical protein QCE49_12510 [Caballeronia sp. LZ008]|uniref:hypothetical protein n=1 Tax=unclassified Caballeronia TaxID=2646786 RepID=UPI0020285352|nr:MULTISPECIES: hypothetical protein [unclassified Caballeronia]MDR5794194.1 hypothetical protein [Caballeronia sp. LZ008]
MIPSFDTSGMNDGGNFHATPWKQLLLEINGTSVGGDLEHDDEDFEPSGDVMFYDADIPTAGDRRERRLRISKWVAASNKARKCSQSATAPNQSSRAQSTQTTDQESSPPLPMRPNVRDIEPVQVSDDDTSVVRPLFVGWIQRADGVRERYEFRPTDEEYFYMDLSFSTHMLVRFRELASDHTLRSITEEMLTTGHWMSAWWWAIVHDLPKCTSTLMDLLDTCHPFTFRQTH